MVRKLTIRLRPGRDDDIIAALDAIPPGAREARLREALRWHLVPGGFRDVVDRLSRLLETGGPSATGSASAAPAPDRDRLAATAQALSSVMAQFQWED